MTNAGFIPQPVAPGAAAAPERPEAAGQLRDDGEFSELLSRFIAGKEQAPPAGDRAADAERPGTERKKILSWLAGKGEAAADDSAAGSGEPAPAVDATPEPAVQTAAGLLSALEAVARAAGGPAPEAPAVPPDSAARRQALPDDAQGRQAVQRDPQPVEDVTANVAIMKKETHLAPGSAATGSLAEWAATTLGANGPRPTGPASRSSAQTQAVEADAAPGRVLPLGEDTGTVSPAAVRAVRGTQPGQASPALRQGDSPMPQPDDGTTSGALPDIAEAGPTGGIDAKPSSRADQTLTPVQMIASRIAEEAGSMTQRPEATGFTASQPPSLMTPVKVLHIQLQPADLGAVTVRMTLKDHSLRLEVEAGKGETARMIQNDRDALTSLLRSAGYLVDGLDVRISDISNPMPATGSGQAAQMQTGGQPGSSHEGAFGAPSRDGSGRQHSGDRNRNASDRAVETDRRGGIFV